MATVRAGEQGEVVAVSAADQNRLQHSRIDAAPRPTDAIVRKAD